MSNYLIGQRVICSNTSICIVISDNYKNEPNNEWSIWVKYPSGVESKVSRDNVKPLPGGQL